MDNAGIFLGLISLPVGYGKKFYIDEFQEGLFANYKESVREHFKGKVDNTSLKTFDEYLYLPYSYYLFGRFDMAILSLIDDFEFGCRRFHPFDPMAPEGEKEYIENFKYQIISGYCPKHSKKDNIIKTASETFLAKEKLPLIGICCLKLNNSLLIGSGIELLKSVIYFIKEKTQTFLKKRKDNKTRVMTVISYSWHELVLIVFSDSYKNISDLITDIRERTFGDLNKLENPIPDFDYSDFIIRHQSINSEIMLLDNCSKLNIDKTHLFENSISIFGFDFEIYKSLNEEGINNPDLLKKIKDKDDINLFTRWFVRPGHLKEAVKTIKGDGDEKVSISIGRGDFIYPDYFDNRDSKTRGYIETLVKAAKKDALNNHITQIYTILDVPTDLKKFSLENVDDEHFYFLKNLQSLKFSVEDLKDIKNKLQALGVPKILKVKILNIFSNFNDGILDTILFGYFAELTGFMEAVSGYIEKNPGHNLKLINEFLDFFTTKFEQAYRNRFHQSYRMNELTDFTIEYKGGIHQLATCFDSAFKAICSQLGNPRSFAYISGYSCVFTTYSCVRLNYFHIFQPEIFVAVAIHEAANFLPFDRLDPTDEKFKELKEAFFESKPKTGHGETHSLKTVDYFWEKENNNRDIPLQEEDIQRFLNSLGDKEQELKYFLSSKYFRYVLVDLISFYFTYNQDVQLFSYWYWNVFMQTPDSYESLNQVDEDQFIGFLLRYLTVLKLSEKQHEVDLSLPPNRKVKEQWEEWAEASRKLLDKLFKVSYVSERFNLMIDLLHELFENAFMDIKDIPDIADKIEKAKQKISDLSGKIRNSLKAGQIFPFDRHDLDRFQFTQAVFYAYLGLIKEEGGIGESVLTRDEKGSPLIDPENDSAILFDSSGGIFTHDPLTRRKYYKFRAALTMTLWDMGMREKKAPLVKKITIKSRDIDNPEYKYLSYVWNHRDLLKSTDKKIKKTFFIQSNDYIDRVLRQDKNCYAAYVIWVGVIDIYCESFDESKKERYQRKAEEKIEKARELRPWAKPREDLEKLKKLHHLDKNDKDNLLYKLIYG